MRACERECCRLSEVAVEIDEDLVGRNYCVLDVRREERLSNECDAVRIRTDLFPTKGQSMSLARWLTSVVNRTDVSLLDLPSKHEGIDGSK